MFVRRTLTRRTGGQDYHSHRLVHSERDGAKVHQRTLLNLGNFDILKAQWPALCRRIDEILNGQAPLLDEVPGAVEDEAQRIAAQLLARSRAGDAEAARDLVTVDVDTLSLTRPRSVGVEQVGLWAIERLGLVELLAGLGVNAALRTAALGYRGAVSVSGLGAGDARLASGAQRAGGVAQGGLRDHGGYAVVPGIRCADQAPRSD